MPYTLIIPFGLTLDSVSYLSNQIQLECLSLPAELKIPSQLSSSNFSASHFRFALRGFFGNSSLVFPNQSEMRGLVTQTG